MGDKMRFERKTLDVVEGSSVKVNEERRGRDDVARLVPLAVALINLDEDAVVRVV